MRRVTVGAAVLLALAVAVASGQYDYFGKNKVQTRFYGFQQLETEHFRILFYPGGETMAEFAANSAESYYSEISRDLGIDLEAKVPLVLYLSPSQFSETNVITSVIEEGVGGFSELFKNRIVLPFNGSYYDFHHVIGHELVHTFEFQMFYRSRLAALMGAIDEFQIPLWVMEGFAEYQSGWVNVGSDVFMRDLVLNKELVPLQDLHDGYGYLVYREGEAFFHYVEEKYGRKKVYEFLHSLRTRRSLEATFGAVFGTDVEEFSSGWERWLEEKYWPQVGGLANFDRIARTLTDHKEDGSVYNTAPAISPSGTKIAMISDRAEYVDCYVISALDGKVLRRIARGARGGGFETMHLIRPGVSWSPNEDLIAIATASAGRDNITLVDYPSGKVRRRLAVGLDGVYSPKFSPDGGELVFIGLKNGFSDVYAVDVEGGEPRRITYDMYEERDPSFSPTGDSIVFVSDRPDRGEEWVPGAYAVWLRTGDRKFQRVTGRGGKLGHVIFSNSGEYLLYTAEDSARNVHVYSLEQKRVVRRTRFLGEVSHLSLSKDDRLLSFAYFSEVGWDVAVVLEPLERLPVDPGIDVRAASDTATFTRKGLDFDKVDPVKFALSVDYVVGAASYGTGEGLAGLVNVAFSDMLGNHRFGVYADVYGDILNSDLILQYWLLPFRVDYGVTLFQYADYPYLTPDSTIVETVNRGGQALAVYPFDRFLRTELGLTGYVRDQAFYNYRPEMVEGWSFDSSKTKPVFYVSPALVFDNTFWTWNGPARGSRLRVGSDLAFLGSLQVQDVYIDARNYQRIARRFVFASRLFGVGSFGRDASRYYIDGQYVRGYDWGGEFYGQNGQVVGLTSFELRFPFIDHFKLAFPLPIEFGGIRGVGFLDGGLVVRDSMRIWNSELRKLDDLKLGAGFGVRVQISYFSLIFDWAWPLSTTDNPGMKFIFGIGTDF